MERPPTHLGRALLGVGLLLGFYVLALGVAAALILFIVVSIADGRYRIGLVGAALVVFVLVRAVLTVDRHGHDEPPGVAVGRENEPDLWALIDDVAARTGAPAPAQLYVVADPEAFAGRPTRLLGLVGGPAMLGIGLSLVEVLTVDQLRAVVAHELGHLHRQDSRLGAVVYRARVSIRRAVADLAGPLERLFGAYERLFLRLTMRVARAQESAADLMSARLVGGVTAADALLRSTTAGLTWGAYMGTYVVPLYEAGRWPTELVEGFTHVLSDPARSAELAELRAELAVEATDPFDSHPALPERAAAMVASGTQPSEPPDDRPARELLRDASALATTVAEHDGMMMTEDEHAGVSWAAVASDVWGPLQAHAAADVREAAAYVVADERGVAHPSMVAVSGEDDDGPPRPRAEPEEVLEILERGAEDELVRMLVPGFDALDGIEREELAPSVLQDALFSVLSAALVERRGCEWRFSLSGGPLELVDRDGFVIDVEYLATLARSGGEHLAAIREAIAPLGRATR